MALHAPLGKLQLTAAVRTRADERLVVRAILLGFHLRTTTLSYRNAPGNGRTNDQTIQLMVTATCKTVAEIETDYLARL